MASFEHDFDALSTEQIDAKLAALDEEEAVVQ
jgi:hypothetical protein